MTKAHTPATWLLLGFLVFLAIIVRIHRVDDPLVGLHDHRMNETAAIARNFHESGMNILYPRIDWRGNGPGYIEEAFQAYTFLLAGLYWITGPSIAVARALSVAIYIVTAMILYSLVRRAASVRVAMCATAFFLFAPIGLYYSTSPQPDGLILLLSLSGVYLFSSARACPRSTLFYISGAMIAVAVMMKPYSLYLGLPLAYLSHRWYGWSFLRKWHLWIYALIAILPAVAWYAHAHSLGLKYGNTSGFWPGQSYSHFGSASLLGHSELYIVMARRLISLFATPAGCALLLFGILLRPPGGNYWLHLWGLGFGIVGIVTAGGQLLHDYYQWPMLVVSSVFMAYGVDELWKRLQHTRPGWAGRSFVAGWVVLVIVAGLWIARSRYSIPEGVAKARSAFARRIQAFTEVDALIAVGTGVRRGSETGGPMTCRHRDPDGRYFGHEPFTLYASHRKGWSLHFEDWTIETLELLQERGARYFVTGFQQGVRQAPQFIHSLEERFIIVDRTDDTIIVALKP